MYRVGLKDNELVIEQSKDDGTRNAKKVWVPIKDEKIAKNVVGLVKNRTIRRDGYRYPSRVDGIIVMLIAWIEKRNKTKDGLVPKDKKMTDAISTYLSQDGV